MTEFFRHCPSCGRRFHIKLVSKKMLAEHRETINEPGGLLVEQFRGSPTLAVYEGGPIFVDVEEFQYSYKCKHCGHEWSENRIKEQREN